MTLRCLYHSIDAGPSQVIHSFIHSFTTWAESPYCVPGTVLGSAGNSDEPDSRDLSARSTHGGAGRWTERSQHVSVSSGAQPAGRHRGRAWPPLPFLTSLNSSEAPALPKLFLWFLSLPAPPGLWVFIHAAPSAQNSLPPTELLRPQLLRPLL